MNFKITEISETNEPIKFHNKYSEVDDQKSKESYASAL